jgi:methyl-accepting chemotaxis protein
MKIVKNLSVAVKMYILIAICILSLIITGVVANNTMSQMKQNSTSMYKDRLLPVGWLNTINANSNQISSYLLELMITTDTSKNEILLNQMKQLALENDKLFGSYEQSSLDPFEMDNIPQYKEALIKYRDVCNKVSDLAIQNKNQEAYALYLKNLVSISDVKTKLLKDLIDYNAKKAEDLSQNNEKASAHSMMILLTILIVCLVVSIAVGYVIARLITKPIRLMQSLMEKAESGDLSIRSEYMSKDEIGKLSVSFNSMIIKLRTIVKQIHNDSLSLSAMSEELSASAEQAGQASLHISEAIQQVSTGAEKQSGNIHATEHTVEHISAGVLEISDSAELVSIKALNASESSIAGKEAIEKSITQMKVIQTSIGDAAQIVLDLGDQTHQIGRIIELISGITSQINLLALNAAIEAARAGEHGRGFAVVSQEVRKLAEQSAEATKQISESVGSIQNKVKTAVESIQIGNREVDAGVKVVHHAGEAFRNIYKSVTEVSDQMQGGLVAIQKMAEGNEQVVKSFAVISEIASTSAAESQNVSAATEEQLASMEEIAASANSLSKMAEELQNSVSSFKL